MDKVTIILAIIGAASIGLCFGLIAIRIVKWLVEVNTVLDEFEADRNNIYDRLRKLEEECLKK